MKTYCKRVDVTDPATIEPWVAKCFKNKLNRGDFQELLLKYGDYAGIALEITNRIKARDLRLRPILFFERLDGMSGKVRTLGMEEPLQQCMDYVAVHALMPLFNAKIGPYQCASIPGRGQVYGKKALEKWTRKDPEHTKYYEKADIRHCYGNITHEVVEKHLCRDVKNDTLIWLVMALVGTYQQGLSIGSYLSQYLCNYLLSYAYHFLTSLHKERRGKRIRLCYHILFYMDDIYISGNDKRNIKSAMRQLEVYLQKEFGLTLKPGHSLKETAREPVDMMGFVVSYDRTTIRARIFIRARRALLRAWRILQQGFYISLHAARRIISYRGFFLNTNSISVRARLHLHEITQAAIGTIIHYAAKETAIKKEAFSFLYGLFAC